MGADGMLRARVRHTRTTHTEVEAVRRTLHDFVSEGGAGWLSTTGKVHLVRSRAALPGGEEMPLAGELVDASGAESLALQYLDPSAGWQLLHTVEERVEGAAEAEDVYFMREQSFICVHPRQETGAQETGVRVRYRTYWPTLAPLGETLGTCPQVGPRYQRFLGFQQPKTQEG